MIHIILHAVEIILLGFIIGALFGIRQRLNRGSGIKRVKPWPAPPNGDKNE